MADKKKEDTTKDDVKQGIVDGGGRRLGIDRRQVDLEFEGPDRRAGKERRTGKDRRKEDSKKSDDEDRRTSFHIK